MARQPMVTRTIQTTHVTVFCVNTETRDTFEQIFTLPRTYKNDEKMMKVLEKFLTGEPIKPISIISSEVKEAIYGMTEAEFIQNAHEMEKRN